MGYDVHITRRRDWSDEGGQRISEAEWEALKLDDPTLAELLWYDDGNLNAKNPDLDTMRKLLGLAERLKARVQGDEGECYSLASLEAISTARGRRGFRAWLSFLRPYFILGALWFLLVWLVLWLTGWL